MKPREVQPGLHSIGVVDWDRRWFDCLIPLPDGTSYNSYLVHGSEATALVDAVDPAFVDTLMRNLDEVGATSVQYLVANHAEQDHSGALVQLAERYPEAKIVSTPRGVKMLGEHLHLPTERLLAVVDGETLSLGDRTLEFLHMPWVHWPETMVTYLQEDKVLLPGDFFGSHLATSKLYADEDGHTEAAAKRYYGEIMMPFANHIAKHLERLKDYELKLIAPTHGPIYARPQYILDLYDQWVNGAPRNLALVLHISMHGSTRLMTEHLVRELVARGVEVQQLDLHGLDLGHLVVSLVDAGTVILGTPTVLTGPHPAAIEPLYLLNAVKPKAKFLGLYGSYGWGTMMAKVVTGFVSGLSATMLDPVLIKGLPREDDYVALSNLAQRVADAHAEAGLS